MEQFTVLYAGVLYISQTNSEFHSSRGLLLRVKMKESDICGVIAADLMQRKGADAERGQLHGVQQRDLDHPICLCAPVRPVLITLYLQEREETWALIKCCFFFCVVAKTASELKVILYPTRDFSSRRVIITTEAALCSHTILQKSPKVSARGPCVAM